MRRIISHYFIPYDWRNRRIEFELWPAQGPCMIILAGRLFNIKKDLTPFSRILVKRRRYILPLWVVLEIVVDWF